MSDFYDDEDDENDGPADLRKLVKKLNKELEAEREARAKAEAKARTVDIANGLRNLKVNEKFARLVPANVDPSDEEALKAWAKEFDLLPADDGTDKSSEPNMDSEPAVAATEEFQAAFSKAADSANAGVTPAPDPKGGDAFIANLKGKSISEIMDAFTKLQYVKE